MDFFEHQEQARKRTGRLVLLFVLAVAAIVAGVYLAVVAFVMTEVRDGAIQLWNPELFAWVAAGVVALIAAGSLFKMMQLRGPGGVVAHRLGGEPIDPDTRDPLKRRLLNVVEEMAIASGTPVPPVFLLDDEDAINAFAAGHTPGDAVIGVTRGCMEKLSRDELQGVIAHEFSHILNGDMRLNIRLMGILHGLLLIGLTGRVILYGGRPGRRSRSRRDRDGGGRIALLGLALMLLGYAGTFFGHLIKAAVSRQREFLADASAVQFTRYPDGIAGALQKIGGLGAGSKLQTARAGEASHMFFGDGLAHRFTSLLSTHPPLDERIERIDPRFTGEFPAVAPDYVAPVEADLQGDGAAEAQAMGFAPGPRAAASDVADAAVTGGPAEAGVSPSPGDATGPAGPPAAATSAGTGAAATPGEGAGTLLDRIGQPGPEHLAHVRGLMAGVPPALREAAHDPKRAPALVYALLLAADEATRARQRRAVAEREGAETAEAVESLAGHRPELDPSARLPLLDAASAALGRLDEERAERFADVLRSMTEADGEVDLSEWALSRLATKHLTERLQERPRKRSRYQSLHPFRTECGFLLSALAHAGHRDREEAQAALEAAAAVADMPLTLHPRAECTPRVLEAALDTLAHLVPAEKRRLLAACATSIAADEEVTVHEAELFRAIADWLDCPVPPLLPGQALV